MNNVSLGNAVRMVVSSMIGKIHTAFPGRVESYDYTKQQAEVQPLVKHVYRDGTETELPKIANVPVVMPRTTAAALILPVKKGDTVLIICAERSMDNWLSQGGIASPGLPHKFSLSDAIAIPGLFPFTESGPATADNVVELQYNGVGVRITADGNVEVGGSSFKKLVNEEFKAMFDNHIHNVSTSGSSTAQTGITSSPVGTNPLISIAVPAVAGGAATFGEAIGDNEMTSKVTAE